jgi:Tol biopolymer transport system component
MKKLLLNSIILFLFSTSVLMFQVSCNKDAIAETNNTTDKIIFVKTINNNSDKRASEVWTANIDGTNQQKVNIIIPKEFEINGNINISKDGTKIILVLYEQRTQSMDIYTCNIDGSNLKKVVGDSVYKTFYSDINTF